MSFHPVPLPAADLDTEPQLAFHQWLREGFARLAEGFRLPASEGFLARSVDHADLERRLRVQERGMPTPLFW